MKTIYQITFPILVALIMTACSWDDSDYQGHTAGGELAYTYTKNALERQTMILTYAYQLNQYLKQTTNAARDSVLDLYFLNSDIITDRDTIENNIIHILRANENGSHFQVIFTLPDAQYSLDTLGVSWKVSAAIFSKHEINYYNAIITNTGTQTWKITESSCIPKCLYYFESNQQPLDDVYTGDDYRYAFSTLNNEWVVKWTETNQQLTCHLKASGKLESVASPKMGITYETLADISIQNTYSIYRKTNDWTAGTLKMLVDDTIEHTTDDITANIGIDKVTIIFKGIHEDWEFW